MDHGVTFQRAGSQLYQRIATRFASRALRFPRHVRGARLDRL